MLAMPVPNCLTGSVGSSGRPTTSRTLAGLGAVAVMIVDVKQGHLAAPRQEVGSDRRIVEEAEAAVYATFRVMPRRPHQRQAPGHGRRRLVRQARFVDFRRDTTEGDLQSRQQVLSIGRARGENDVHIRASCCCGLSRELFVF